MIIQDIDGKRVVFKGEGKVVPSCLIPVIMAVKLVRKGCPEFLAHIKETNKACRTNQYSYCKGIPGCVPREITWIEVSIDTFLRTSPIAQSLV